MLKNGANINLKNKDGNTLSYYLLQSYRQRGAEQQHDDFDLKMKILQDNGLDFTAPQRDGNTLYHIAVGKNDVELFKKIANLKIDVNAKNAEGMTVLHKAAMVSKDDVILKYLFHRC